MPLLGKEPFIRATLPADIDPDDEVFYCKITQEAFTNYDQFFERAILCSSMVWTCSVTGRANLTFEEAVESENKANHMLTSFPSTLQLPALYLMKYISESKFNEIINMIYTFISDRFFVGEEIYVNFGNVTQKKLGKIIRVIPPSDEVIANEENRNVSFGLDPALYKYEVQQIEPVTADSTEIMGHEKITRSKSILTKDRIRLFLKQHIVSVKRFHPMILKDESIEKYGIDNVDWEDIFAGPDPNFDQETVIVKTINNKDKKKLVSELKKKSKDQMSDSKSSKKKHSKEKPRELTQEEKQRQKEELRQLRLEQKKLEKEKLKEQKKQHEEQMKEWNAKRDDLACDDLQPLPKPTPIDCDIPIEFFEDVVAISEFFHNFHQLFDDLEDVFPTGITFDLIKQAILDRDDDSQLIDIIQLLLENIFALQQEYEKTAVNNVKEDENEKDDKDKDRDDKDKDKDGDEEMNDEDDDDDFILKNAMKNANNVTNLIYQHYGCPLTQVAIDSQNLIEVLKFHLTSSGSGSNSRAKNRGGFAPREDPCLWFVINNAELIKKFDNPKFMLYDLNPNERLSIIHALIDQTLTYESFRNEIDDAFIQIANLRRQLRDLQANLSKWIKENNVKKTTTKKDSSETNDPDSTEIIEVSQEQIDDFKREKAKKEEETQLKCMEIRSEIRKYQSRYKLEPIGVDRAFRRYYIFESLPGLFVEHNDYDNGMCLTEPTPDKSSKPRSLDEISNSITKRNGYSIKKARICGDDSSVNSDKENDVSSSSMDTDKPQIKNGLDMNQDEKLSVYDRCTGNTTTCYVHGMNNFHSNEKVRWSFYHTPEQLDALISNLNNRGHRESELQSVLIQDKQAICDILLECQPHKLNKIISQPKIPRQNNHFDFMMCDVMLKKLQRYKDSGLFYKVPSKRFAPNYKSIIKNHIDFGIISSKLNTGIYHSNIEFFKDILLMLGNCTIYWPIESDEFRSGRSVAKYFDKLLEEKNISLS